MDELERTSAHARAYREQSQMWQARAERAEAAIQRVKAARSRLRSSLIAVSRLLDQPYPDAPDQSPWTRFVHPAMRALDMALAEPLDTVREAAALDPVEAAPGAAEWAERAASASTASGHTVGCTCYGCEQLRAESGGTKLDAQRPEERSGQRCICGTPGAGNFDGPQRDCPVHGERGDDRYRICPDCTRCGCGMWEKHHGDLSEITPAISVPAPERSDEEKP